MSNQRTSVKGITSQEFYINRGLYVTYDYEEEDVSEVVDLIYYKGSFDCHCPECNQNSIFKYWEYSVAFNPYRPANPEVESIVFGLKNTQTIQTRYKCSRIPEHVLFFTVLVNEGTVTKIGQFPSYADVNLQDVSKYKKLLPNELYLEFKKSIGLYTHNVGAGSLVYLRRIIEKFMIEPAYQDAKKNPSWDDDLYQRSRVRDRMNLLKDYLPEYLVSNSVIYGIVSKGIHELSERECLQYYPVLKSFIEFVLVDMKNRKEEQETRKKLSAELSSIAGKL